MPAGLVGKPPCPGAGLQLRGDESVVLRALWPVLLVHVTFQKGIPSRVPTSGMGTAVTRASLLCVLQPAPPPRNRP